MLHRGPQGKAESPVPVWIRSPSNPSILYYRLGQSSFMITTRKSTFSTQQHYVNKGSACLSNTYRALPLPLLVMAKKLHYWPAAMSIKVEDRNIPNPIVVWHFRFQLSWSSKPCTKAWTFPPSNMWSPRHRSQASNWATTRPNFGP